MRFGLLLSCLAVAAVAALGAATAADVPAPPQQPETAPPKPGTPQESADEPAVRLGGVKDRRSLANVIARLREGPLGRESVPRTYLDRIEASQATAEQINDFAIYLAGLAYYGDAVEFQAAAVRLEPGSAILHTNLGMLQRKLGRTRAAIDSFRTALRHDPNSAMAHYGLGAAYDDRGRYDLAIDQYRIALTLDPRMGDPKFNPQVVNNERGLVVNLLNYQARTGALGLPLSPLKKEEPPPPASAKR